jgi:LysM repeat protein
MGVIMRFLLGLFLLVSTFQNCSAQIERYTLFNGKRYLIHVVEKGNTMYSISRKYDVDVKSILDANPYAKEGIKFGQELRIPLFKANSQAVVDTEKDGFIMHTVRRKETLFSLSQAYNIPISDIERFNPEIKKGIHVNDVIKIPKAVDLSNVEPSEDTRNYFLHTVAAGQTLYSFGKLYNVNVDDIKALNGGLPEGLKGGSEIKIPRKVDVLNQETGEKKKTNIFGITDGKGSTFESKSGRSEVYTIALFLPFDVEKLEEVEDFGENQIALEYYLGFKMAIDSLRKFGANIELKIYDTEKNADKVRRLLYRPEMSEVDFLVGPMYKSCLEVALPFALSRNLNVLCPVPQSAEIADQFPNLILTQATKQSQFSKLCSLIKLKNPSARMISIGHKDKLDMTFVNMFHGNTYEENNLLTDTVWHYVVDEQVEEKELEYYLAEKKANVVFVASEEVGFVSEVLTALNGMRDYDIKVIGFESWEKFNRIETEYKNNTSLTIPSNFYVDYEAPNTKLFLGNFYSKFGKEPNKFGVMGYDQGFFFGKGLYTYGFGFFDGFQKVFFDPIGSKYLFEQSNLDNGFKNKSSFVLTYKDFELKPFTW